MAERDAAADEPLPNPNQKLIKVFDSEQEPEALVVKGLLDSAGIDCDLASASLLQDAFPGLGGMIIRVREEDAEKARNLIADSRTDSAASVTMAQPDDDDDVTAEMPAQK